jgi:hypothetical protein
LGQIAHNQHDTAFPPILRGCGSPSERLRSLPHA